MRATLPFMISPGSLSAFSASVTNGALGIGRAQPVQPAAARQPAQTPAPTSLQTPPRAPTNTPAPRGSFLDLSI